jgi:gliding motility-associated-like protein
LEVSIGDSLQVDLSSELYPNGYEVSTFEGSDGRIELQIEGGLSPYEINLNDSITIGSFVDGLKAGLYTVYVRDRAGCLVSDSIRLFEAPFVAPPSLDFSLPNAFTPNGDGFNDFYVISYPSSKFRINTFQVWDIGRQLVYSANNYANTWDGKDMKGNRLLSGTYFVVFTSPELKEPAKTFIDIRYE